MQHCSLLFGGEPTHRIMTAIWMLNIARGRTNRPSLCRRLRAGYSKPVPFVLRRTKAYIGER